MIPIYRPAPSPDVNTEQAGRVWYYLTDAGMKLEPVAYLYARQPDTAIIPNNGWSIYGGEANGYIILDDTERSWEHVSARVEEWLAGLGFTVRDRPDTLIVMRTEDGGVMSESLTSVMIRHAVDIIADAVNTAESVRHGTAGWKDGGAEDTIQRVATLAQGLRVRLDERVAWSNVAAQSNRDVDDYLRTIYPALGEHYGMPVDGVRRAVVAHHEAAEALWQMIDDIDTLDDACRDDDAAFRRLVRGVQQKRHGLATSDGYRLYWKHRGEVLPEYTQACEAAPG